MSLIKTRVRSFFDADKAPAAAAPKLHGHFARATWEIPDGEAETVPFDLFQTSFLVPPEPVRSEKQTLFLFPGAQPSRKSKNVAIFQPVLQWGPSATGGSNSWTVQTYYVRGTQDEGLSVGAYSSRVDVKSEDRLTATIRLVEERDLGGQRTYFYTAEMDGLSGTYLGIDVPEPFALVGVGLEVYAAPSCGSLPNTSSIVLESIIQSAGKSLTPVWDVRAQSACSATVKTAQKNDRHEIIFEYDTAGT